MVPSITDGSGKLTMAGILADPATRSTHVRTITDLVINRGYDGIDLDYEGFAFSDGRSSWATTRPNWAAFVAELGASLHAQGKLLSVTVPPIWDNGSSGYWVYAWPEMLPHVDRLRLMVYDWSVGSPGPVSPLSWQTNVINYVRSIVPRRPAQQGADRRERLRAQLGDGHVGHLPDQRLARHRGCADGERSPTRRRPGRHPRFATSRASCASPTT